VKLLKVLAITLLASLILSASIIWFYPQTGDFKPDNSFWNGSSKFVKTSNATIINSLKDIPSNAKSVMLLTIPYTHYDTWELEMLKSFLIEGGILVLMDDYGYGNELLEYLNLSVRFSGKPLLDPLFNYKNKWFPKISIFSNHTIFQNVTTVLFNHATALVNTSDVEVLAWSSSFSFLDLNDDGKYTSNEPMGPLPVIAKKDFGNGSLILISDPSIIINSMIDMEDNQKFLTNLINVHGKPLHVLFDISHLPRTAIDDAKDVLRYLRDIALTPPISFILVLITVIILLKPLQKGGKRYGSERGK